MQSFPATDCAWKFPTKTKGFAMKTDVNPTAGFVELKGLAKSTKKMSRLVQT